MYQRQECIGEPTLAERTHKPISRYDHWIDEAVDLAARAKSAEGKVRHPL
jgi:hypothetical protein